MQKIRFIESNLEYDVNLALQSGRVVCIFQNKDNATIAPLSEGFVEINEHNGIVQGSFEKFKYIYKAESDGLTFILTDNENDIYVEPKPISESELHIPTEDEIAEQEKLQKISELTGQINNLKKQLEDMDYIFIKSYEATLVGESIDEYDFKVIHQERQLLRNQINDLQEELNNLV